MYTFLTTIILTKDRFGGIIRDKVDKYKFIRNYMFTIRGYTEGRMIIVNVQDKEVLLSKSARKLEKFFKNIF